MPRLVSLAAKNKTVRLRELRGLEADRTHAEPAPRAAVINPTCGISVSQSKTLLMMTAAGASVLSFV